MILAIGCIIIDGLAGFYYGKNGDTTNDVFKKFLLVVMPELKKK